MLPLASFVIGLFFISFSYGRYPYETKYIDVPLDHFSFYNNRTLKLRYLINDNYWKPSDGPIFFYTGNEDDIENFAQNTGFLWEAAEKFNALIVFAEHRYYGKSLPPCEDHSNLDSNVQNTQCNQYGYEYFAYLSSRQVLADYVDVVYEIKNYQKNGNTSFNSKQSNPVIAFGGSLGGMLAAWMRMKYPAVIEGALASSAPIAYFSGTVPCDGYNKALTKVFNDTSSKCVENIRSSWRAIRRNVARNNGTWLSQNWNLCEPVQTYGVSRLINFLNAAYSSVGLVNYPYPNDFLMPVPANPVKEMCKYLNTTFEDDESLLTAIYKSNSVYMNHINQSKCFDWLSSPYGQIDIITWGFQVCSELIEPQCRNGVTDMFEPSSWDFAEFSTKCKIYYGVTSDEKFVQKEFGGKDLRYASNIIFSNGLLDPWYSGAVTENDVSSSAVVIDLPDSAHHLDLRAKNPADPPSVERARIRYADIFRKWIKNYHERKTSA